MNTKRKLLIAVLAVLSVSLLVFGTFAVTDAYTVDTPVSTGSVKIQLNESFNGTTYSAPGGGSSMMEIGYTGGDVMPGQSIAKEVDVENIGKSDAYVRVSIEKLINDQETKDLIEIECDTTNWTYNENDGYYYYNKVLKPTEKTVPLFSSVKMSGKIGEDKETEYKTAAVTVTAQATQVENNGTDAQNAAWANP